MEAVSSEVQGGVSAGQATRWDFRLGTCSTSCNWQGVELPFLSTGIDATDSGGLAMKPAELSFQHPF